MHPLSRPATHHFAEEWASVRAMGDDDPDEAVQLADALVGDVLRARGCRVSDFELGSPEIAAQYPAVLEHYRAARAIATRIRVTDGSDDGDATRRAFAHFDALFAELLEGPADSPADPPLNRSMPAA